LGSCPLSTKSRNAIVRYKTRTTYHNINGGLDCATTFCCPCVEAACETVGWMGRWLEVVGLWALKTGRVANSTSVDTGVLGDSNGETRLPEVLKYISSRIIAGQNINTPERKNIQKRAALQLSLWASSHSLPKLLPPSPHNHDKRNNACGSGGILYRDETEFRVLYQKISSTVKFEARVLTGARFPDTRGWRADSEGEFGPETSTKHNLRSVGW